MLISFLMICHDLCCCETIDEAFFLFCEWRGAFLRGMDESFCSPGTRAKHGKVRRSFIVTLQLHPPVNFLLLFFQVSTGSILDGISWIKFERVWGNHSFICYIYFYLLRMPASGHIYDYIVSDRVKIKRYYEPKRRTEWASLRGHPFPLVPLRFSSTTSFLSERLHS